ncbi:MAG: zinc ribbon domain-containing protein [Chitinophagaceae bacterium]|uniref:zinc-ribbon domain-containing protein n=1 Tax=unclassified Paraflavitalea TaxID=2798305 RepID=UPI003D33551A|nr:zinc ribbon domain-containing protein [Chitinophagaceae bacterium]
MLIYGSRATKLKAEPIVYTCKHCQSKNTTTMVMFQKYAHVFWIPFCPIKKLAVTQCEHCKQVLEQKQFDPELKEIFAEQKSTLKTPIWTFIGLALLIVLIVTIIQDEKKESAENKVFLEQPQVGDVYTMRTKEGNYTLFLVKEVTKDSIGYWMNNYEVNKISGLHKIPANGDSAYLPITVYMARKELLPLLDKGEIHDVSRKK